MTGMKKKAVGLDNGEYIGISFIYDFRCDPDLGIEKEACRRIPCACLPCLEILKLPWEKELQTESNHDTGSMSGVYTGEVSWDTTIGEYQTWYQRMVSQKKKKKKRYTK